MEADVFVNPGLVKFSVAVLYYESVVATDTKCKKAQKA